MPDDTTQLPIGDHPAPPPPSASVAHHARGRLRLRIPARKGDTAYFTRLERELAAVAGVAYAEANPLTASVLLHFTGDVAELAAAAAVAGLFTLAPPPPAAEPLLDLVTNRVEQLEQAVLQASHSSVDLDTLLFVGLVGAGVVQVARGRALGPASTLLANAVTILALHRARRAGR